MKYILELKNNGRLFDSFLGLNQYLNDNEIKDDKVSYLGPGNWEHALFRELEKEIGDTYFCDAPTVEYMQEHYNPIAEDWGFEADLDTATKYCRHQPEDLLASTFKAMKRELEPVILNKRKKRRMNPNSINNLKQNRK